MNGIPASIIFDNLPCSKTKREIKPGKLQTPLKYSGQDRTYFVFPLKWALTLFTPLTVFNKFYCTKSYKIVLGIKSIRFIITPNGCKNLFTSLFLSKFFMLNFNKKEGKI